MSKAAAAIARGGRPILVIPTGGGKTFTATSLLAELGVPTLWLAHRIELIEQAAKDVRRAGLTTGIIKAGVRPDPTAPVQVASVHTLRRRVDRLELKPELIVIDECHGAVAPSYLSLLSHFQGVPVLGLTATPFRLDGRGLGDVFDEIIVAAYTDELVAAGWLHAPKVYAAQPPDLRGVKIVGGDYNLAQLAQRMTLEQTADVVKEWQERAAGRRTVCFAVDREHSRRIVAAFQAAGVAAEHLDGDTHPDYRRDTLERLASGELSIVSNCMILTEGWDLPALECAIVCRPTASLNLHLQMIGRIMRAAAGKSDCIVLDHAGNHYVHGMVTRRLEYSLDGDVKTGQHDPLGLRQCGACYILYESKHERCPECGHRPTPSERVAPGIHGTGHLTEFKGDFDYRWRMWNLIEADREAHGYKPAWSVFRYRELFGVSPAYMLVDGRRELVNPETATLAEKEQIYKALLQEAREAGHKDGAAAHKYKEAFGVWPKGFVSKVRGDRESMAERWAQLQGGNQG